MSSNINMRSCIISLTRIISEQITINFIFKLSKNFKEEKGFINNLNNFKLVF